MTNWSDIAFAHPYILWGLLLIPLLVLFHYHTRKNRNASFRYSSLEGFSGISGFRVRLYPLLFILRMLVLALLIAGLARPRVSGSDQDITIEGIDIVITLDISSSMLASDFSPNRLEAAKWVANDFISGRVNDRMGLVIFSGETFTLCPITSDNRMLHAVMDNVSVGMLEDGTAIGDGLATSVQRLRNSSASSKVVILLTDGVNNRGVVAPHTAAQMAQMFNIRVYTIGVGSQGVARTPVGRDPTTGNFVYRNAEVDIDEETLKTIADLTGGKYFRATDKQSMSQIYESINQLEKTRIDVQHYEYQYDIFFSLLLAATILLAMEIILRKTVFHTVP